MGKKSKVLFVHCPPVDEPLSTEDVIDGLKRVITWVVKEEVHKEQRMGGASGSA